MAGKGFPQKRGRSAGGNSSQGWAGPTAHQDVLLGDLVVRSAAGGAGGERVTWEARAGSVSRGS